MFQYIFAGRIQIRRIRNSNVIRIAIKTGGASLALTDKNVSWSSKADISIYFSYCLTLFSGSRNLQVNPRRKRTTRPKKTFLVCCWLPANLAVVKMLLALNLGCTSISYRKCVSLCWRVVLLAVSVINGLQMQRNAFKLFVCLLIFVCFILFCFVCFFFFTVKTLTILLNSDHATAEKETLKLWPHYGG